jgi:hypothetical protein
MKTSLEQTIMAAIADDTATASGLAELIATTESAIVDADAAAEAARAEMADPIAAPDLRTARAKVEATEFTAARLRSLVPRLMDRHREIVHATERADWLKRFADLEHQRNNLAAELASQYPKLVSQLIELFGRAGALDQQLSRLHQSRPSGCKGQLLSVELTARGLSEYSRDQPPLARELRIPDFHESNRLLYPPRDDEPFAVTVSGAVSSVHSRQRHSGDWHKALTAENEQRRLLEQQRIKEEAALQDESKREFERTLR